MHEAPSNAAVVGVAEIRRFEELPFGFLIESVGLALTAILLTLVAAYARPEVKLGETLILGAGLALFTVVVFVYLLGQALPACPPKRRQGAKAGTPGTQFDGLTSRQPLSRWS